MCVAFEFLFAVIIDIAIFWRVSRFRRARSTLLNLGVLHFSLVRITEELFQGNSGSGLENRN
jgi:hypothetical protein